MKDAPFVLAFHFFWLTTFMTKPNPPRASRILDTVNQPYLRVQNDTCRADSSPPAYNAAHASVHQCLIQDLYPSRLPKRMTSNSLSIGLTNCITYCLYIVNNMCIHYSNVLLTDLCDRNLGLFQCDCGT